MQYRLLRNNKETGPYTREQLLQTGFKPYDLVWADGMSASWSYPSEMHEFKAFAPAVEEQPFDRFYKKKDKTVAAAAQENVAVIKEKPRIRIRADWKKIDATIDALPPFEKKKTVVENTAQQTAQPEWQRVYTEWQQHQHTVKEASKKEANSVVETKFSQSLSDIKERYIETVLKDKKKKTFSLPSFKMPDSKNLWPGFIILLLALGFFLSKKFKTEPLKDAVAQVEGKPAVGEMSDDNTANAIKDFNNKGDEFNGNIKADEPEHITVPAKLNSSNNEKQHTIVKKNVAAKSDEVKILPLNSKAIVAKNKIDAAKQNITTTSTLNKNVVTKQDAVKKQTAPASKPVSPDMQPKRKIDDYVLVSKAAASQALTVQDVHLAVKNISGFPIDLAVVEVKYFDVNGRYQKGETVFVKNLGANQSKDVKVPDSRNSYSVNYKISLVSADQSTLYLIAD